MAELLSSPQKEGLSTLVLLDEVLMYVRARIETDPAWRGRLMGFFQYLTQAVVKVDRCAMVASLLASDPTETRRLRQRTCCGTCRRSSVAKWRKTQAR